MWPDIVMAITSIVSAIATSFAAIAAWRAFKVYERMHISQEMEIQRTIPTLKITVKCLEYNTKGIPRAEYRLTLFNIGNMSIILTDFSPYTDRTTEKFCYLPS
jgi:hypothetical protein